MAHQHDVSGEMINQSSRSYAFGLLLSRIFHPIFMNVLMFLIVGFATGLTILEGLKWTLSCIAVMVIPPTLFFMWRLRQGVYSDEDVSVRHQRTELYMFGIVTVIIGTAVLVMLGLPRPFLALLVAALGLGLVGVLINSFWKISVHAGSVAATATVASLFTPQLGVLLWLGALGVGWARVRTRNHTPAQVAAGLALSAIVVLLAFRWVMG